MGQSPRLNWTFVALLVVIVAIITASVWFGSNGLNEENDLRQTNIATETEDQHYGLPIDDPRAESTATAESGSAPCLTLEQLETHPVVAQDAYRYEAVIDSGPVIAAYRGLSEQELQRLTAQGDSAAMAVLGAMSVMRARDWPVDKAVSYLMLEDPDLLAFTFTRPFSPEFINHMAQARQWFYKAALHGRVMVLWRVGDSLTFEQGGPVELGWISKDEYDSLSNQERISLEPSNVYNVLAFEVAPGLTSGPQGEILAALMPRSEQQLAVVDQLAEQFDRDLQDAGLPPIVVPESNLPSFDDLLLLLCENEQGRLEEIRKNVR